MKPDRVVHFFMMYLGAFVALRIQNVSMAYEFAGLTENEAEAVRVIAILRESRENIEFDGTAKAMDWLRQARSLEMRP